jgi:hypothetical protein
MAAHNVNYELLKMILLNLFVFYLTDLKHAFCYPLCHPFDSAAPLPHTRSCTPAFLLCHAVDLDKINK